MKTDQNIMQHQKPDKDDDEVLIICETLTDAQKEALKECARKLVAKKQ